MEEDAGGAMRRLSLSPLTAPRNNSQLPFTPVAASTERERSSDLLDLRNAYVNEKVAPELLDYQGDLVTRVEELIKHQETLLADAEQTPVGELVRLMRAQSLTRARYLLRAYLRTRLLKLERFCVSVLNDPAKLDQLSPAENQYAQDYFYEEGRGVKEAVLQHMPENFQSVLKQHSKLSLEKDIMPAPNLDAYVFVRVLADCGQVAMDAAGDETVELSEGDLLVTRYRGIRDLLRDKWLQLV
ncbi:hypothetical protein WJX81_006951 [Elliptochloris bilobata]|uniref:DNA replication complex GINS protein SLD5 n=1 Tax=Elliptochloris bilobata TaxID=381761 RepID=A0AAW1QY28_9CHLO